MGKIDFLQLKNYLDEKQVQSVAVAGNDAYLVNKAVSQITERLNLDFKELNYTVISDDVDSSKIVNACLSVPFMSQRRMVVVRDYALPKAESEKIKLRDYLYSPNEQTCLVICFKDKNAVKEFDIDCILCDKLDTDILIKWIISKAKQLDRKITPQNAERIVSYCLNDMGRISCETEKLCDYSETEITAEAINMLVEKESEYVVWELAQEISRKNPDRAMAAAASLLDKGEEVVSLIASIYALFRRMFYSAVSAMSMRELAVMLDVKEYSVKKAREVAESFTQIQLKASLELCRKADEEVKTFNSDKLVVFNRLILGLLNL